MSGTQVIRTELISYRISHLKVAIPALAVGGGALVLAVILGLIGGFPNFLHAYLAAYLFWFGLTAGCIGLTMLHHLTGGRWGECLRPLLESGAKVILPMAILFVPILCGMYWIYPWTQPDAYLGMPIIGRVMAHQHAVWMNGPFFIVRYFIYFGILGALVYGLLRKYKLRDEMTMQDPAHNTGPIYRMISGPGIVILGITVTLSGFDWGMSVQPGWYSTIYGLASLVGEGLSTMAFMVCILLLIVRQYAARHAKDEHPANLVGAQDWHDLGNLLLAFTMLWGYVSLSQFLITYSGNLPQETVFYNWRSQNGWQYIGGALIALHFALPFFLLLMRDLKRDPKKLVLIAGFILLIRQLDFYYQIHPAYTYGIKDAAGHVITQVSGALGMHTVINLLTPIGIGGLWVACFAWNLKDRRVLPAPAQEEQHG